MKPEPKPVFTCPLDIAAYYLKYPKVLVDHCKAQKYYGDFWIEKPEKRMKSPRLR